MKYLKTALFGSGPKQGQKDLVADIFTAPPSSKLLSPRTLAEEASGREKFEMSALPARDSGQTNWRYSILKDGQDDLRLVINQGQRGYQWNIPGGGQTSGVRRLADVDREDLDNLTKELPMVQGGRLQVHKSGPSSIYATMQDGKNNPTFELSMGKGSDWSFQSKARPGKPDLAATLMSHFSQKEAAANGLNADQAEAAWNRAEELKADPNHTGSIAERLFIEMNGSGNRVSRPQVKEYLETEPRKGMDNLFYPIYKPPGGSIVKSLGLAGGIGAGLGLAYHGSKEFSKKREAELRGEEYKPTGSALKRSLIGGLIGTGVSAGSNLLLNKTNSGKPVPALGSNPFEGFTPKSTGNMVPSDFAIPEPKTAGYYDTFSDIVSQNGGAMSLMDPTALKGMIFGEQAITWSQKKQLMDEVAAAELSASGPAGIPISSIAGTGLGGLAGYMIAKKSGSGPIATGVLTGIGSLIGNAMTKDRPRDLGDPVNGQPGFKIYS